MLRIFKHLVKFMNGDEAYAGSKSWSRMESVVADLTSCNHILATHEGPAAERILYSYLGGEGKMQKTRSIITHQ